MVPISIGWLTRLTAWLKGAMEAAWKARLVLWEVVKGWWRIGIGIVFTLLLMIKESLQTVMEIAEVAFVQMIATFDKVGEFDQSNAFAGSPTVEVMTIINTFIPLQEIFAGTIVLAVTWGLIFIVRTSLFVVFVFKRVFFQWV